MKKTTSAKPGNKNRQVSNLKTKAPDMHDSNLRRQPPTPQDIQRVQPVSQKNHPAQTGKNEIPKSRKGIK